jgi:16S rRNA processing protein RimM
MSPLIPFATLGRPHGLRGEISAHPFNEASDPRCLALPADVELVRGREIRALVLAGVRPAERAWLLRFAGIDDRTAAQALTGAELWIPRAALPPLPEDAVYVEDLLGCRVVDTEGRDRGTVRGSFWNGAHDVLSVIDAAGAEWLVPAVPEFLHEIDLAARRLVVDPHE